MQIATSVRLFQTYLADWLIRLRATYQDEIGLHIHPFCNFVNTAPGVPCRFKPSESYDKGNTTGYTVLSSAYSESEYLKLLKVNFCLLVVLHRITDYDWLMPHF